MSSNIREGVDRRNAAVPTRQMSTPSPQNDSEYHQAVLLMFSREKLLHMNRRSLRLTGRSDQADIGPAGERYSQHVRDLRNAIQAALDQRRAVNLWEPFEFKRVLFEKGRRILLRGLGLADRSCGDDSRIVIVIEEMPINKRRSFRRTLRAV